MNTIYYKLRYFVTALIHVNWVKTIYMNFRMMPMKDAMHLPIIIRGRCRLSLKGGRIQFDVPIRRGLLKIGYHYEYFYFKEPAQINIQGLLILKGEVWIGTSVQLAVGPGANLMIGDMSTVGSGSSLICTKSIVIGECLRLGTLTDISDSNYHYMKNTRDNSILPFNKAVKIGNRNYIGSRAIILPGTITPDNITIGFGSICNKDYRTIIPENSIIAGVPAKLVKENVVSVFDFEKEAEITKFFSENPNEVYYVF